MTRSMAETGDGGASVRVDRWLLAARVYKTRSLAQDACAGGKVDVNRATASPHKAVRVGDRIRVSTPRGPRELVVRALAEKRLSSPDATLLYEDVTPPPPPTPEIPPGADVRHERGFGRPSKRDRRQIDRIRGR
jgi:ribosome-associated heat shock protein Hsp15